MGNYNPIEEAEVCLSELVELSQDILPWSLLVFVIFIFLSYLSWKKSPFFGVIFAVFAFLVLIYSILLFMNPTFAVFFHEVYGSVYNVNSYC